MPPMTVTDRPDARLRVAATAALTVWDRYDSPAEFIDDTAFHQLRAAMRRLQAAATHNA